MKQKWYLSTFVFVLVLLGYSRQQAYVPNQEIVMQFVDADVTNDVTQNAIASVKKQLQTIGIANIQVRETAAGRLKITYYSDLDVVSIKRLLSQEIGLELGYSSLGPINDGEQDKFPSNDLSNSYNINVCEIQNGFDAESDFNGYVLELTFENERLYNPVEDFSKARNDGKEFTSLEKVAYLIQKNISLAINNPTRTIPEVRAGPSINTNS